MDQRSQDLEAAISATEVPRHLQQSTSITFNELTELLDFSTYVDSVNSQSDLDSVFHLMKDWAKTTKQLLTDAAQVYELNGDRCGVARRAEAKVQRLRAALLMEARIEKAQSAISLAKDTLAEYRAQEEETRPHQLQTAASGLQAKLDEAMQELSNAASQLGIDTSLEYHAPEYAPNAWNDVGDHDKKSETVDNDWGEQPEEQETPEAQIGPGWSI